MPFLETFVQALYKGEFCQFHPQLDNPLMLTDLTIFVPTRRAARALHSTFVEFSPVSATFLPNIRPLGDGDDDEFSIVDDEDIALSLDQPIGYIERLLLLARLIKPWRAQLPAHIKALYGADEISIPTSTADAVWLGSDLARLMDEIETQEADWSKLKAIAPEDIAEWWQVTLDFLEIVGEQWPLILRERQLVSPALWRNKALRHQANRLAGKKEAPVIALGSTGSFPATADLVKTIALLPRGAVILPGLDRDLDEPTWQRLIAVDDDPTLFTHPQYNLAQLIAKIGTTRDGVRFLGEVTPAKRLREKIVAQSLRPADTTELWARLAYHNAEGAFADVSLLEAHNEREEALAIAIILRQAILTPKQRAALITNDRNIARRVSAELKRFGITANDSAGQPLSQTVPVTLIRLLLASFFQPVDVIAFVALLKHPLCKLQSSRRDFRHWVEKFELFLLRGATERIDPLSCQQFVDERLEQLAREQGRRPALADEQLSKLRKLARDIDEATQPFKDLLVKETITTPEALAATIRVMENFARDEDGAISDVYSDEAGQALIGFCQSIFNDQSGLRFSPLEWPKVFDALLASVAAKPQAGGHPRIMIWGTLEARLQSVDTVIIAGMNESQMPTPPKNDPFMSRLMKAALKLAPPELRIGLAAHDFQMLMGTDSIFFTRALRVDNDPSVPSRWLQRLETVLGDAQTAEMKKRGRVYIKWARMIDEQESVAIVQQPRPAPPLSARPKHFSVTEIEMLRRDPYAIYAKKILRLKPLEALLAEPSAAQRGSLYHEIVAQFIVNGCDAASPEALNTLFAIAREKFNLFRLPADVEAIWWPRFMVLAQQYIEWERKLSPRQRFAEISSIALPIGDSGVTLKARADRIDKLADDHSADIIDFKTSSNPTPAQARTLFSPQLALEAALLEKGAFTVCGALRAHNLLYIRLLEKGQLKEQNIIDKKTGDASTLAATAWQRLEQLINYYLDSQNGYLSHALPMSVNSQGDYDHLARVAEWSAADDEDE